MRSFILKVAIFLILIITHSSTQALAGYRYGDPIKKGIIIEEQLQKRNTTTINKQEKSQTKTEKQRQSSQKYSIKPPLTIIITITVFVSFLIFLLLHYIIKKTKTTKKNNTISIKASSVTNTINSSLRTRNTDTTKFRYDLAKGRLAEHICEELFNALGFVIERYGMETSLNNISNLIKKCEGENKKAATIKKIRNMPDFVIEIPNNNNYIDLRFLEVKYRKNADITKAELSKYSHYDDIIFLIFSKTEIYFTEQKEINILKHDTDRVPLTTKLEDVDLFNFDDIDKKTLQKFKNLSTLFYKNLPTKEEEAYTQIEKNN